MSNFASDGKFERKSLISHTYIINDEEVKNYVQNCAIPANAKNVTLDGSLIYDIAYPDTKYIECFIAVDGESTTVPVNNGFPSSLLTFFQFGSLAVESKDLDDMEKKPFVSPEDIKKLKEIRREKLVLPTKNIALQNGTDFKTVVRTAIQDFFRKEHVGDDLEGQKEVTLNEQKAEGSMLETVFWFIFEMYNPDAARHHYLLPRCPHCGTTKIELWKDKIVKPDYSWECPTCERDIFITDVLQLFERVDEEAGAAGIVAFLKNVVETFLIIHIIKKLLKIEEGLINRFLFVKDGPLSFGGESDNMRAPMQALIGFLNKTCNINLVGVESSGPFVEHAKEISNKLKPGQAFLLNNKHIYTNILVGNPNVQKYGEESYYSGKMIYKSLDCRIYVLTMPVANQVTYYQRPEIKDFKNIQEVLFSVARLRCDIYENALIPIAVINKLVSLSTQSGAKILEKFAKKTSKKNEDR